MTSRLAVRHGCPLRQAWKCLLAGRHAIDLLECFQAMTSKQRNALLEIAKAFAATNAIAERDAPGAKQSKAARPRRRGAALWRGRSPAIDKIK
jgi:hypothetical protein